MGRFSYTAVVALSIPFSVVTTFAPMYLGNISLNIMSLGGLALGMGMLVDSSIVVLEAIFRRREEGEGAFEAAVHGASEVGGAVFASTLTTVAVFFPIVFVEGMAGQVFRDQALTVVFSLLASLVAALTLIPMLAARIGGVSLPSGKRVQVLRYRFHSITWVREIFVNGRLVEVEARRPDRNFRRGGEQQRFPGESSKRILERRNPKMNSRDARGRVGVREWGDLSQCVGCRIGDQAQGKAEA